MRPEVRALVRPLVRTVALLLALGVGVVACLLVFLVMVRGSSAEALPPLAGATPLSSLVVPVAQRGGGL
jgi:hypothetical protein